jgi:chaperonin GroES
VTIPFRPIQDLIVLRSTGDEFVHAGSRLVVPQVIDPDRQIVDERDVREVLGVGPGKRLTPDKRRPMSVRVGDRLVFGRNKGMSVAYDGVPYIVLREQHAIGRINGHGFEPLNGMIVVEPVRAEQTLASGIVLPETSDERDEATVVMIGPGEINDEGDVEPVEVETLDRVLYYKRMGEPFVYEGRQLLALRHADILCIVNRD